MSDDRPWQPIANAPLNKWLQTKREDERGFIESFARVEAEEGNAWAHGDNRLGLGELEWCDRDGYTTVANPGSFAPPTHWRLIV